MDDRVSEALAAHDGVASVAQLGRLGCSRQAVDRLVRRRQLIRLRRDVVVEAEKWVDATAWEKHAIRGRAVMQSLNPDGSRALALSHHSALAIHGVAVFGGDNRVHLVRTDSQRGRSDGLVQVHAPVPATSVILVDGLKTTTPALSVIHMAGTFGACAGMVAADSALHGGSCTVGDLAEALDQHNFGSGVAAARLVVELADARIESAGESRARWVMRSCGLPEPVPQVLIENGLGFAARVDFLFAEQRTIVEFDGMLKYQTPEDVYQEKIREDRLRSLGYEVVRLTWDDLRHPDRVRRLIQAAFARRARSCAS